MKTTLELPDELFRRAKQVALERGTSLKAIVTKALERELGPAEQDYPPIHTHVWPPPGTVAEKIPAEVVLKAIRAARDEVRPSLTGSRADEIGDEDDPVEAPPGTVERSRGGSS